MKKEFYKFLAEHGLVTEFNRNFSSKDGKDYRSTSGNFFPIHKAKFFAKDKDPLYFVSGAFDWTKSPEKWKPWMDLNTKWQRKIRN